MKDPPDTQEAPEALKTEIPTQDDMTQKPEQYGWQSPKTQTLLSQDPETHVAGEGEDYFLSLFGDSKKLISRSSHVQETCKHFSMILEEVGQSISSSLGDIKIAEVNVMGLFVKLVNSSRDKELDIGGHTLQQNVNGQPVSLYCFVPNTVMQANSMVTVWAAASEGKHQPPSDFVWKEQVKFQSTPDCTTILCKPSGEAVAWYTPIHWKQAWEKLETDIEFDRCSVVTPTFRRHVFRWTASETTMTKEKQDEPKEDPTGPQEEQGLQLLKREKEIPPSLFPNRSPWCNSPCAPAHPYSPLIDPHKASCTRSSSRPRPQPAKPSPAPDTRPGGQGTAGHVDTKRKDWVSPRGCRSSVCVNILYDGQEQKL
uniref:Lamin tail domain-containing protein 1 n=1 Tax=Castor canadensis TaxID=51338 RepID=A0A8B7UQ24_CASCN|nr:lamin tail domain-containing protein 1 [Castor canadensis]